MCDTAKAGQANQVSEVKRESDWSYNSGLRQRLYKQIAGLKTEIHRREEILQLLDNNPTTERIMKAMEEF